MQTITEWILDNLSFNDVVVRMNLINSHRTTVGQEQMEAVIVGRFYDDERDLMGFMRVSSHKSGLIGECRTVISGESSEWPAMLEAETATWHPAWLNQAFHVFELVSVTPNDPNVKRQRRQLIDLLVMLHLYRLRGVIGLTRTQQRDPYDMAFLAHMERQLQFQLTQNALTTYQKLFGSL